MGLPQFSIPELQALTEFNNTLISLEVANNELPKSSTTLVEAEGIFQFMFKTISKIKNLLSEDSLQCLKKRITERRIKFKKHFDTILKHW